MSGYIIRFPHMASPRDPQPLGVVEYPTCDKCGEKVKFRIKKTCRTGVPPGKKPVFFGKNRGQALCSGV